jgi:pyruvate dehydrogenase E1 component
VILAKTKKGYGMGTWGQGKMGTHQQKKLDDDALKAFRDRFALPLSDEEVIGLKFYRPADSSPEMRYQHAKRKHLGGYLPERRTQATKLQVPARAAFAKFLEGSSGREQSTTMQYVQLLSQLLKDKGLGRHVVPIVADEARTFGMQSLFRNVAIYAPQGQLYEPEDREELLYYKEAQDGQILEEGITEAGALASWIAAATSYSTHGVPMLPFYIFYSMFGFQRVGDLIWAAADSRSRGFLMGATAGRTTLAGEGLQHQDGSSHLVASTIPNCVAYDPCYGYELAVILQDGARRMLEADEDVFYYVTVMNENYAHPAMPVKAEEGILKGMHCVRAAGKGKKHVRLLGAGAILREALAAAEVLESEHGVAAEVWSVTSFTELRRDGRSEKKSWVGQCLENGKGPVIAASDYVSALADLIREWVPGKYVTLGTDGFGRSDTRANLRAHFGVDRAAIVQAALGALKA